ncbi:uncharacterized protein LOC115694055 [Syzygium oleosum]|uniref:uncharacterized protein LOC115694055 n=1 Tax=Syzygium oleosum TaxID=219896 RepID=UPI0024B88B2F|nr:uncharacterized protein LOC115694055 [Syzygium oleosum]
MYEKLVQSYETGEVIDCVDIFKQPAFDHPLLKNHTAQYAQVSMIGGNYRGANAKINVWNPTVMYPEVSFSQIWLMSGPKENLNTVEAGWMVTTVPSTGNQPELFIYWTSDGYQQTGCYNLECPGFVQTSSKIALGSRILPVSTYGGKQYDITIGITKNDVLGRWWLRVADVEVGYWPGEIFTTLGGSADVISWGGEIVNSEPNGRHTSTEMGSGHFPSEGFGKAAFFRNLKFVDDGSIERDAENLKTYVTRPECYDLLLKVDPPNPFGVHFFFGGSGFSAQCAN